MGFRRSIRTVASGFGAAALLLAANSTASAFCRTTTCDPGNEAEQCTIDDKGCTRTGAPLTWSASPIVFRFYESGSQKLGRLPARQAVRAAFDAWSFATCGNGMRTSLRFEEQDEISDTEPSNPHLPGAQHFGIYFRDDSWTAKDADSTLALTTLSFGKTTGNITVADIEINTTEAEFATNDTDPGVDLQAVVTHEVGHYIGLAHSLVPASIMVASYCASDQRCSGDKKAARALSDDDISAVCSLYPPPPRDDDGVAGSCAIGARSSANVPGSASAASFWVTLGGAAMALAGLRRRARSRNAR